MRRLAATTLAALSLTACATVPRTAAPQISEETLRTVTTQLSSDGFEGRAPGTDGERITVDYLTAEFARVGLRENPGNVLRADRPHVSDLPLAECREFRAGQGCNMVNLGIHCGHLS